MWLFSKLKPPYTRRIQFEYLWLGQAFHDFDTIFSG